MGKLGNFELNAEQRKAQEFKNQRRAELRALYLKNVGDPHRQAVGDGGHLVNTNLCTHNLRSTIGQCYVIIDTLNLVHLL